MTSDEAWTALIAANQEEDLDDFKVFFLEYVRNNKELTFVDMEKKFRDEGLGVYLIAIVPSPPKPFHSSPTFDFQSNTCLGKRKFLNRKQSAIFKEKLARNISFPFQLGPKNRRTRYLPKFPLCD